MDDPFVQNYEESDLEIAAEFLTNWMPFLSRDLCSHCAQTLATRIRSLDPGSVGDNSGEKSAAEQTEPSGSYAEEDGVGNHFGEEKNAVEQAESSSSCVVEDSAREVVVPDEAPKARVSWADMAQEDELEEDEGRDGSKTEVSKTRDKEKGKKVDLSRNRREHLRFMNVVRKKDFIVLERVRGKIHNVLDGLELHSGVFTSPEQNKIVKFVYGLQEKGRNGDLGEHTYSEPSKWMQGKGRVTIQFGCCYNYAVDKEGNPPGILRNTVADPLPSLLKTIIKRLVRWHVLPPTCIPDSCIINIYEPGDCIPPHIDSHDFVRPFCTVSFLSECNIVFGSNLRIIGPGEFSGSAAILLPVGSVLVLNGNGADLAKHAVPAVPAKRISITFRKMDDSKRPFTFKQEPDLQGIQPLPCTSEEAENIMSDDRRHLEDSKVSGQGKEYVGRSPNRKSGQYSHGKLVAECDAGSSSRRSSHGIGAKEEGHAGRLHWRKPYNDSQGILPSPQNARRSSLENPKAQALPVMRIMCMDDKRIVVRSGSEEESLSSPSLESPPDYRQNRIVDGRRRK